MESVSKILNCFFNVTIVLTLYHSFLKQLDATTGNNFTCLCTPGFQGPLCDLAFCQVKPCENEGFCLTNESPMVIQ